MGTECYVANTVTYMYRDSTLLLTLWYTTAQVVISRVGLKSTLGSLQDPFVFVRVCKEKKWKISKNRRQTLDSNPSHQNTSKCQPGSHLHPSQVTFLLESNTENVLCSQGMSSFTSGTTSLVRASKHCRCSVLRRIKKKEKIRSLGFIVFRSMTGLMQVSNYYPHNPACKRHTLQASTSNELRSCIDEAYAVTAPRHQHQAHASSSIGETRHRTTR